MKNKKTFIFISIIAIILTTCTIAIVVMFRLRVNHPIASIYQNGELIKRIDLLEVTENFSFTIEEGNNYNTIEVSHRGICISHASCPDQICVQLGVIENSTVPITCLPNHLIIKIDDITQKEQPFLDDVSN